MEVLGQGRMVRSGDSAVYPRAGVGVECGEALAGAGEDGAEVLVAGGKAGGGGVVGGGDGKDCNVWADIADDGAGVEVGADVASAAPGLVIGGAESSGACVKSRALQGEGDALC